MTATALLQAAADDLRGMLDPPDATTAFGRRYLAALQDDPAVVLAHRDATAALRD